MKYKQNINISKKILKIIIHKVQGKIKSAFENNCKEFQKSIKLEKNYNYTLYVKH